MNILVTGGAGYIGSHATLRLLLDGHAVTVIDDFSRGNRAALERLEPLGDLKWVRGDLGDRTILDDLLRSRGIQVVMHFGAAAYVGESVAEPLRYYQRNTASAISLLSALDDAGVDRFIFSSTCASYGEPAPDRIPITETCPQDPINPYGRSKWMVEKVLFDHVAATRAAKKPFAFAALRYFNVAGSDAEGRIGEDHKPETHLIPICLEVALGQRDALTVFGTDYPTPDGTCVRDYVHVDDLIDAHVAVMDVLEPGDARVYNVGIGRGDSVHAVLESCRRVTGHPIPARDGARRPGDPPVLYADPSRIRKELGWTATHTDLDGIVATAWKWRHAHPHGYVSASAGRSASGV